jgi:hypothetical protein
MNPAVEFGSPLFYFFTEGAPYYEFSCKFKISALAVKEIDCPDSKLVLSLQRDPKL